MDEYGYVFATVPATSTKSDLPVVGFIAHVDTSPEMSGAGVKAIIHRNYDGKDIVLPDDPSAVISPADNPQLASQLGNDVITASGTTLLGADNKAGVAEIMGAVEYLVIRSTFSGCVLLSHHIRESSRVAGGLILVASPDLIFPRSTFPG